MVTEKLKVGMYGTNSYLVMDEDTKDAAVVDPGDDAGKILAAADRLGARIRYIFLTHSHFDHILAAASLKEQTGAALVVHELEGDFLKKEHVTASFPLVKWSYKEAAPDILARDGDTFPVGNLTATYLHTPGHTPGSSVILIGDSLYSGDTLFCDSCGRCDLKGGDEQAMKKSLARLYALTGDYTVYPGHMDVTTLERERQNNPYMKAAAGK